MKTRNGLITVVLMLGSAFSVFAQNEVSMPASFVQHGNKSGNVAPVPPALESIDSVTVGAAMRYWVQPDASVASGSNVYTWTIAAALGSQTAGGVTNLATVTFGATPATGTISVIESTSAGCNAGASTIINVATIAKPTGTFASASSSVCASNVATVALSNLATTLTSAISGGAIRVTYTITDPSNATGTDQTVLLSAASSSFTLPAGTFNAYGVWKIKITQIDDRISIKSNVAGTVGAISEYQFTISKTPTTGPVFHLPNN
jgi:hypothetical protein